MIPEMQHRGSSALDRIFDEHDVIVALADSPLVMYSAAAGKPQSSMHSACTSYAYAVRTASSLTAWWSGDSMINVAIAGYPIACCPLGTVKYSELNERPYGLCVTAGKGGEGLLLRFMAACEAMLPQRPLPKPLLHYYRAIERGMTGDRDTVA